MATNFFSNLVSMVPSGRVMVYSITVSFWPLTIRVVWWLFDDLGPAVVPVDGDKLECANVSSLVLFLGVVGRRDVTTDDGEGAWYDSMANGGRDNEEVVALWVVDDLGEAYDRLTNAGDKEEVDDILGDMVCVSMRPSGYSVVISFLPLTMLVVVLI